MYNKITVDMTNFEKWDKEFRAQNLYAFNHDANALLWLKVRAVCRGKQIDQFLTENSISLSSTKIAQQNAELFEILEKIDGAMDMLDAICVSRTTTGMMRWALTRSG